MTNAERQQEYRGTEAAAAQPQPRNIPADWFLDPADPQAAAKYQDGLTAAPLTLEEQATALLAAAEAAERAAEDVDQPSALHVAPVVPLQTEDAQMDDASSLLDSIWSPTDVEGELAWQVDALCAQTDPEAFFPEKGGSTRDAKKVCAACTVREECLEYALEKDERFGIWGGLSERERRRLRKKAN
ncbi:WhiB family transcriptional regulator [Micrococcoides hystricis]|uniref:Transcriptional regulator WhiB n=1 Tax=Micrococcoides hystricis TaxID=1572761 RepID=A0ABV6PA92_9MICC